MTERNERSSTRRWTRSKGADLSRNIGVVFHNSFRIYPDLRLVDAATPEIKHVLGEKPLSVWMKVR